MTYAPRMHITYTSAVLTHKHSADKLWHLFEADREADNRTHEAGQGHLMHLC